MWSPKRRAFAWAGDVATAEALARGLRKRFPIDTSEASQSGAREAAILLDILRNNIPQKLIRLMTLAFRIFAHKMIEVSTAAI